jgi:multidrug resistance efflux pump
MKSGACILLLVTAAASSLATAQELPKRNPGDPLEFEPDLQLYDIKPDPNAPKTEAWAIPSDPVAIEKAKTTAERAKRKADRWQKLQKAGIVSKVEMEQAIGAANRATVRYQQARVAQLAADVERLKERAKKGEASSDLVQSAESALQTAKQLAEESESLAKRTELEFAQNNLERQRKLAAAGLGSRRDVEKAAAKVETVKAK